MTFGLNQRIEKLLFRCKLSIVGSQIPIAGYLGA